jgi:hypothetical protein
MQLRAFRGASLAISLAALVGCSSPPTPPAREDPPGYIIAMREYQSCLHAVVVVLARQQASPTEVAAAAQGECLSPFTRFELAVKGALFRTPERAHRIVEDIRSKGNETVISRVLEIRSQPARPSEPTAPKAPEIRV